MGALLGLLAHAACVEHHQIRAVHRRRLFPAEVFEDARDALRIGHIHLAAHGPDMVLAHGATHLEPPAALPTSLLAAAPMLTSLASLRPCFSTLLPLPDGVRSSTSPSSTTSSSVTSRTSFGSIRSM